MFAQAAGGPKSEEVALVVVAVVVGIMVVAGLALQILFLLTLKRALEQCAPHNRQMEPGHVLLNLIPCFGAVWMFITVNKVSKSVRDEFDERGVEEYGDFGQQLGISYAALILAWVIPYVGFLFGIAGIVCWILYWVKIARYARTLREGESYSEEQSDYRRRRREEQREDERRRRQRRRNEYDDEDDDDDRPSRRRRYDD
jgi:hypothetical protein